MLIYIVRKLHCTYNLLLMPRMTLGLGMITMVMDTEERHLPTTPQLILLATMR